MKGSCSTTVPKKLKYLSTLNLIVAANTDWPVLQNKAGNLIIALLRVIKLKYGLQLIVITLFAVL